MDAVLSSADLLQSILGQLQHVVTLSCASVVSKGFHDACRVRMSDLEVLSWQRTIRGRAPALASTGFYFHRHCCQLPDGTLCVPDVNNRCLRVLTEYGACVRTIASESCRAPRGPACAGKWLYTVQASGQWLHKFRWEPTTNTTVAEACVASAGLYSDESLRGLLTPDTCAMDVRGWRCAFW